MKLVDPSRPEVITDNPNDVREIGALVCYPAIAGTGTKAGYFPELAQLANALRESGEIASWQVAALQYVRSPSNLDAAPVRDRGPFPVVILSPGNGTNVEFYTSIASEIASYGYVVVGLNHPYDVAAVELSDGRIAQYNESQWSFGSSEYQAHIAERISVRTQDVSFVLDQLVLMNSDASQLLTGVFDLNAVAATGHSLGGITASEACKADVRLKACLNWDGLQAGSPFSTTWDATPPTQPFLFLTKETQLHPRQIERFEASAQSYWVVIHGAAHDSFTDGPSLMPSLFANRANRYMNLIQEYTLAFLEVTLKRRSSELLTDTLDAKSVTVHRFSTK